MRAGIVGASGYTGSELMRILSGHPEMSVTVVTARAYEGERVSSLYPSLDGFFDGTFAAYDPDVVDRECDVVFLGLPHGESMRLVPEILEMGKKVVDLSADFRLSASAYREWYGSEHQCPSFLTEAVYGLPEINRREIGRARLVANPGCYPTAAILGTYPLSGIGVDGIVVVDAKSGVSGAGRAPTLDTHFPQATDSISPYAVARHRHQPEIDGGLERLDPAGQVTVVFTPHLAPMSRGILCTIYVPLAGDAREAGAGRIRGLYEEAFAGELFLRLLPEGTYPGTKAVQGSNICHVSVEPAAGGKALVVMSAIDNLVKGASGQAVQNMNILCGYPEEMGLEGPGLFP